MSPRRQQIDPFDWRIIQSSHFTWGNVGMIREGERIGSVMARLGAPAKPPTDHLEFSRLIRPTPEAHLISFKKLRQPVLEAAGAKSWVTFSKGALYCSISEEKKEMVLTPMRTTRPPGAFEPVPEREVNLMLPATAAQIGAGVREALTRCE